MRGKRAAVFPVSYLCSVFFSPPLPLRPRSLPSLSALRLSVSVFALKESLEQKRNAQLADIQKKWDRHMCEEMHACVSTHSHTHTHLDTDSRRSGDDCHLQDVSTCLSCCPSLYMVLNEVYHLLLLAGIWVEDRQHPPPPPPPPNQVE